MKIGISAFVVLIYVMTETSGVVEQSKYCGSYWSVHKGTCFKKYFAFQSLAGTRETCESYYSKIIIINSTEQLKFIQTMKGYEIEVWVDLYRRTEGESPGWYWGDGTPFVPTVLKWNKGLESLFSTTAFALTTQGTVVPISESTYNGYACEVKPTDKICPKDYKLCGDTCCFLSDLSEVASLTYTDWRAGRSCRKTANGSQLLEIRSPEKMRAVSRLITVKSPLVWYIGLIRYSSLWLWTSDYSDASSVKNASYIKWANENDNLGGKENCAVMFLRTGRLKDVHCRLTEAHGICTKPDTLPMFSPFTGKFGCGNTGWLRGGMSCYLLVETLKSWDNASANCHEAGGHLVKIASSIEATWIRNIPLLKSVWTGLCYEKGAWRWTDADGQVVDNRAIQWDAEPKTRPKASCAVMNAKGEFIANGCNEHYSFVCEFPVKDKSECPDDWSYFNQSCYILIANNRTTWRDARYHCRALADAGHYSYLFFPRYVGEIDYVLKTFLPKIVQSKKKSKTPVYIWTLLTDDNTGVWGYTHSRHQPIDMRHINWRKSPREEATERNGAYCAVFDGGFLVDHLRNATFMSLCERPLGAESKTVRQTGAEATLLVPEWLVLAACGVMATRLAH